MQGDYFAYNTQAYPQTGYTPYACAPYPNNMMPMVNHRSIDKLKNKHKSISGLREFNEDFGSHSTDESIHLVRSRKTADESRYETSQMMKKRSQSGTSIMKGMASQLSVPRSHSDRSISPSLINEKRKTRKEKKSSKKGYSGKYDDDDSQYTYSDNRLIDPAYFIDSQAHYHHQQTGQFFQPQQQQQMQYANQFPHYQHDHCQQHQQQFCPQIQQQQAYNTAPPGAPLDYYNQSATQNFNTQSNPSQTYYQQADAFSGTQTFVPQAEQQNLPNGAKIVAEYFLGYLDEQQQYQQQQQQQQTQQLQVQQPSQQAYQSSPQYQPQQFQYSPQCPPGCEPAGPCPVGCIPEGEYSSSESAKEEVEIEIWEKAKKEKKRSQKSEMKKKSFDDFKKLSDIIGVLEKKLDNLKVDGVPASDPIQPIFLMPKQAEQAPTKPIYVPRNIYVPVIRPVFVPRERIIVRPQIIHVARPVLVDRPVPIQQRPLVIERDRPVPVRVETIERTEPVDAGDYQSSGEPCEEKPGMTETTYHEFSQNNYHQRSASAGDFHQEDSSSFNYHEDSDETNKNKQLVLDLLEEAERRKKSLESKSNDSLINSQEQSNTSASYGQIDMPYNTGYTLEVLDQRVSDRFEKVDQETIKQRYGVDSFQYLPSESNRSFNGNGTNDYQSTNIRSSGGSYKSLASANEVASNMSAYANTGLETSSVYGQNNVANSSSNGNLSSILTDLAKITAAGNKSS